jgi:hypothetical protein
MMADLSSIDNDVPGQRGEEEATYFNPLNVELNPTCHLLAALLGAHPILHVSRIRVTGREEEGN